MKKAQAHYAIAALSMVSLCGSSGIKMVEADAQGGLIKYRRHGIGKDSRHEEALSKADAPGQTADCLFRRTPPLFKMNGPGSATRARPFPRTSRWRNRR